MTMLDLGNKSITLHTWKSWKVPINGKNFEQLVSIYGIYGLIWDQKDGVKIVR